jgi:hypothetical protein
MCSIALLTEVALLVHVLFVTRQALRWYLLLLVPLNVSIWSFCVAWYTSNKFEYLSQVTHFHLTPAIYHALKEIVAQLVLACQLQTAITIVVFAIMIFMRRIALPHIEQPPVWTLAKDHLL